MCIPEEFWIWLGRFIELSMTTLGPGAPVFMAAVLVYYFATRRETVTFRRNNLMRACEEFSEVTLKMTTDLHIICIYATLPGMLQRKDTLQDVCSRCIDHDRIEDSFVSARTDKIAMIQGTLALLDMEDITVELEALGDLFENQFLSLRDQVAPKELQNTREQIRNKRIQIIQMMRKEFKRTKI